ncbi:translation initiation factor IF-2-like [Moschus berezovskii]|uniref:translation initiation factor IF-2-like n=1 Tax=Moschus berezovskii TaxID=68408 RepID=UPI002443CA87|nr:translation initiation factor IF-2-like [Moschus berezovskii]
MAGGWPGPAPAARPAAVAASPRRRLPRLSSVRADRVWPRRLRAGRPAQAGTAGGAGGRALSGGAASSAAPPPPRGPGRRRRRPGCPDVAVASWRGRGSAAGHSGGPARRTPGSAGAGGAQGLPLPGPPRRLPDSPRKGAARNAPAVLAAGGSGPRSSRPAQSHPGPAPVWTGYCQVLCFQQELLYILAPLLPIWNDSSEIPERQHPRLKSSVRPPNKTEFSTFRMCIFFQLTYLSDMLFFIILIKGSFTDFY